MSDDTRLPTYKVSLELLKHATFLHEGQDIIVAVRCIFFATTDTIIGIDQSGNFYIYLDPLLQAVPLCSFSIGRLSITSLDLGLLPLDGSHDSLPSSITGVFLRVDSSSLAVRLTVIELIVDYLLTEPRKPFQTWLSDLASLFEACSFSDAIGLAGEMFFIYSICGQEPAYLPIWSLTPTSLFDFEPLPFSSTPELRHIEVKTTVFPSRTILIKRLQDLRQRDVADSLLCNVILRLSGDGHSLRDISDIIVSYAEKLLDKATLASFRVRIRSRLTFLGEAGSNIKLDLLSSKFILYSFSSLPHLTDSMHPAITIDNYRLDLMGCRAYDSGLP